MYMAQNQQISQEIFALKNQLQLTNYIRSYITSDDNRDRLLPTNTGVENVNIQGQISEYNDKILTRNNLLAKSSEKNPLVIAIDEQLAAIRSAMIASIDNSIVALNTQIRNLQGSQASTTSKLASNPSQAKYLLSVERQQKVKESLYLFLLQKREENELSQAFTAYNTRIMEQPGGSTAPTSPKRSSILLVAFAIGLAIPFAIVFAKEMSNTKVRGRKDVEHLVTPFLGEIPMHGKEDRTDRTFVVRDGSRNIINEAFRVLRTNFEFMRADKQDADVIAVTSFNPGSGKSFLTMNLAVSLALKSQRVLVIDGDMRHGSSSAYVGTPSQGLSNYLSGAESDADSIIVKSADVPNLWVLPIGSIPPNPTELLETEHFGKLIASQRTAFDYIIIDCPPIEVVADAQIIDRYVDRTVFVVRAGLLERSMLPELDRLYEEKKYHNMAFVLNATRNDQGRYGYSHSYRYGYGYGYGYGYNYGEKQKKHKSKKSK
jgi:capsular exopolysaccharide synthesis family protein